MEDSLGHKEKLIALLGSTVLILVVMEDSLGPLLGGAFSGVTLVLILVVMEDSLGH